MSGMRWRSEVGSVRSMNQVTNQTRPCKVCGRNIIWLSATRWFCVHCRDLWAELELPESVKTGDGYVVR